MAKGEVCFNFLEIEDLKIQIEQISDLVNLTRSSLDEVEQNALGAIENLLTRISKDLEIKQNDARGLSTLIKPLTAIYKRLENAETLLEIAVSGCGIVTNGKGKTLTKEEMMSLVSENLRISKKHISYQLDELKADEEVFERFDDLLLAGDVE